MLRKVIFFIAVFSIFLVIFMEKSYSQEQTFSPEVIAVLEKKMGLIEELARDAKIIKWVSQSNLQNQGLSLQEILNLDARWMSADDGDEFVHSFVTNECAQILKAFQKTQGGFPEIFIADEKGLIVGDLYPKKWTHS